MSYPIHPVTGLRALGFSKRGPIWPVIGGNGEGGDPPTGQEPNGGEPQQQQNSTGSSDKGFPENTPIAEMTTEQQLAYFKHHDRRKADQLKAFDGLTPDDAKQLKDRNAELEREKLSADERTIADARDQAATEARTAAETEATAKWGDKLLTAVAGVCLTEEQQKSFLAIASADKFIKDGEFDVDALIGHMTSLYGTKERQFGGGLPQHQNWGLGGGQPPNNGAQLGLAEAEKRFGKRTKTE